MEPLDAEEVEGEARADHVDDGVHRAHVVEVHLVDGDAVGPRLRLGESREDARRPLLHRRRESALLDDAEHGAEVPLRVLVTAVGPAAVAVGVDVHVHLGGPEARLAHLPPLERIAGERQLRDLRLEGRPRCARVHERGEDHVARRSARAIEVRDPHGRRPPAVTSWRAVRAVHERLTKAGRGAPAIHRTFAASLLIWLAWAAAP